MSMNSSYPSSFTADNATRLAASFVMSDGVKQMLDNPLFQAFAEPVPDSTNLRDADFLLRKDGLLVNVEGWYHPCGYVIGEILYVPDSLGNKNIFGQKYRKVTLVGGTDIPYSERNSLLSSFDANLSDAGKIKPYFAVYKQFFPLSDFVGCLSGRRAFTKLKGGLLPGTDSFLADIADASCMIKYDFDACRLGVTGAPLLGRFRSYHDLDLAHLSLFAPGTAVTVFFYWVKWLNLGS